VNGQYGVGDFKYVVICDPLTLRHMTWSMRIAPKTLIRLISKLPLIQPPESCKLNWQYRTRDSKYVVICDPPTLGNVPRRMRIAQKTLYNGESHQ